MVSFLEKIINSFFGGFQQSRLSINPETPQAFNIIQDRLQTLALPAFFERIRQTEVVKPFLLTQIKEAQSFLKRSFKAPPVRTKVGGQIFLDGRPISRAEQFQPLPKGSSFGTNPFTGLRIPLPVGPRGSAVTEAFFGGKAQLQFNQNLVNQGLFISNSVQKFISDLQARIKIIDTNSV